MDNEEMNDEETLKDAETQPQTQTQDKDGQPQGQTQDGGGLDSLKPIDYFAKYGDGNTQGESPQPSAQQGGSGKPSAPSAPSTGGEVTVSSATRLADDRSWERNWEDMKRRRSAERSAAMAAARARQDLLDDGRYFDDGRGNIKLKEQYRRVERYPGAARRLGKGGYKTLADDGGAARSHMRSAAEQAYTDAYEARLGNVIAENRRDMGARKMSEAAQGVRKAEGNLAIYGGLVAALDNLRNGDASEDEFGRWGDKDTKEIDVTLPGGGTERRKVSAKYDYDAQGRATGLAAEGKRTGMKIRSGFVSKGVLGVINSGLKDSGDQRRITGIVARQRFNPDFPDKAEGVRFYVQGVTVDPKTGRSEKFGRWMDAKGVYQMALKSGKDAGFGGQYSEDNLIDTWGDLFGTRATKEREARMKAEDAERKMALDKQKLDAEADWRREDRRLKAAELYMSKAGGSATDKALLGALPKAAWNTILAGKPLYKSDDGSYTTDPHAGKAVMGADGNQLTEPLTAQETMERIGEVMDALKQMIGKGADMSPETVNGFVNRLLGGETESASKPQGQGQGQGAQPTPPQQPGQAVRPQVQGGSDGSVSSDYAREIVWGMPNVPVRPQVQGGAERRIAELKAEMERRRRAAWERAQREAR